MSDENVVNDGKGIDVLLPGLAEADAARAAKDTGRDEQTITPEQYIHKINAVKNDPNDLYFHPEKFGHGKRVEEVQGWYKGAYPEPEGRDPNDGLGDLLRNEGWTPDSIKQFGEEGRQALEGERLYRAKEDAERALAVEFGTEDSAQVISYAHYAVDRFLKNALSEADWKELDSKMGNDVEFIKRLSSVIEYLDHKYWKGSARSYRRKQEE